jgi:septal ring factor EnvC (AmiA/AmiB activator)
MAKSPAEQIRELATEFRVQEELLEGLQAEMKERKAADEKRRDEAAELQRELAIVRQVAQERDEQRRRELERVASKCDGMQAELAEARRISPSSGNNFRITSLSIRSGIGAGGGLSHS